MSPNKAKQSEYVLASPGPQTLLEKSSGVRRDYNHIQFVNWLAENPGKRLVWLEIQAKKKKRTFTLVNTERTSVYTEPTIVQFLQLSAVNRQGFFFSLVYNWVVSICKGLQPYPRCDFWLRINQTRFGHYTLSLTSPSSPGLLYTQANKITPSDYVNLPEDFCGF